MVELLELRFGPRQNFVRLQLHALLRRYTPGSICQRPEDRREEHGSRFHCPLLRTDLPAPSQEVYGCWWNSPPTSGPLLPERIKTRTRKVFRTHHDMRRDIRVE